MGEQVPALCDAPVRSDPVDSFLVIPRLSDGFRQGAGDVYGKAFRQQGDLPGRGKRFESGQDGHGDAGCTAQRDKTVEHRVVEKHLRDDVVGPSIDFLLEMLDIRLQVGRLEMFLRISADTDAEAAVAFALKGTDGSDQAIGVGVAVRIGREALFPGEGIAAEGHHVFNAHEREVLQQGFRLVGGRTRTDQMRNHLYLVTALDGGTDRYGTDPVADDAAAVAAVGLRIVADFVAVRGHVDVARREFHERRDAFEQGVFVDAAQGRYDFQGGEGRGSALEHFGDFHSRWDRKSRASASEKPRAAA